MNIFVLDNDPRMAAAYHCDKHVIKMILESAQILSTITGVGYKPTHAKHPCTLWAAQSQRNAFWLHDLAVALNNQFIGRYNKKSSHASMPIIRECYDKISDLPDVPMTPFAQAMPEQYKHQNPVVAYRQYYIGEKHSIASWINGKPNWWPI